MNIDLIALNTKGRVDFDFETDLEGYENEDIKKIENLRCSGFIIDNATEEYELSLHIEGRLILKSAINESDVPYDISIDFEEMVENLVEIHKNSSNSLDILPIIWENILLEIPIRATNSDDEFERVAGEGWEILTESDK